MIAGTQQQDALDAADGLERRAYVAGWRWGAFCGWVAGMLGGSALVGSCLLMGRLLGSA